jgi:hypothetical protein
MDNAGILATDTQVVFVGTSATVDSVWAQNNNWFIFKDDTVALELSAHFNDGIIRKISTFPNIQYTIQDPAVLTGISGNSFKGLMVDTTVLQCVYGGHTTLVNVIVLPKDTGSVLHATISAGGPITICAGGQVTLTASQNNFYAWSTGETTRSITVNAPGIYEVEVSDGIGEKATSSMTVSLAYCSFDVNIKAFIQGYYIGNNTMNAAIDPVNYPLLCDTMIMQLAQPFFPYNILNSDTSVIDIHGNGVFHFTTLPDYDRYFVVLRHRNFLETWSKEPVIINSSTRNYDFTISSSQAYGNNLALMEDGNFALYSGDVNQNGSIDTNDFSEIENNSQLFLFGYLNEDITGDGFIESADYSLIENNIGKILSRP